MKDNQTLPDIIILYGPPLAGKGTQGLFLESLLPDFVHVDFGTELRKYVENCGKYGNQECVERAKRIEEKMNQGNAVETDDLRFVVENTVSNSLQNNKSILIEGPGRIEEEAIWLSTVFSRQGLRVAIVHLHIDLKTTLERAKLRWYCPGYRNTFIGKSSALESCDKPYQRAEDIDENINTKRYTELYENRYAKIIQIYQLIAKADILTLDASDTIQNVSANIEKYLKLFYNYKR